jgi:hypothetical protein
MPNLKPIPTFEDEDSERKFWATHDSTEFVDWSKAKKIMITHSKARTTRKSFSFTVVPTRIMTSVRLIARRKATSPNVLLDNYLTKAINQDLKSLK